MFSEVPSAPYIIEVRAFSTTAQIQFEEPESTGGVPVLKYRVQWRVKGRASWKQGVYDIQQGPIKAGATMLFSGYRYLFTFSNQGDLIGDSLCHRAGGISEVTITGLKPETSYQVQLSAINGKGEGESSSADVFKTEPVSKWWNFKLFSSSSGILISSLWADHLRASLWSWSRKTASLRPNTEGKLTRGDYDAATSQFAAFEIKLTFFSFVKRRSLCNSAKTSFRYHNTDL